MPCRSKIKHDHSGAITKFIQDSTQVLNGKHLKVSVKKLHTLTSTGTQSTSATGTLRGRPNKISDGKRHLEFLGRARKTNRIKRLQQNSRKNIAFYSNQQQQTLSNDDSIDGQINQVPYIDVNHTKDGSQKSKLTVNSGFEASLVSLFSNCESRADSPPSVISEDTSSQASGSIFGKGGQLLHWPTSSDHRYTYHTEHVTTCNGNNTCKWSCCSDTQVDIGKLQEHIKSCHIQPQTSDGSFVCLWNGCKVYNKPALSRAWLERHVLHHSGDKPFKCIIEDCGLRFSSRYWLESHVRAHFGNCSNPTTSRLDSCTGTPNGKVKKRKVRKRIVKPVKTEDFFNQYVMENIKGRFWNQQSIDINRSEATFHSNVIAKRQDCNGSNSFLLHWTPSGIIPDKWVEESERNQVISIPLSQLPQESVGKLDPMIYNQHRYRNHRRK